MSAAEIIENAENTLVALDRARTFRFRATRRIDAESYLATSRAIVGCSEAEISAREGALGGRYSDVFRAYLRKLGRRGGSLFHGSVVGFDRHDELGRDAADLLAVEGIEEGLPSNADVFLLHQGYQFLYVRAVGSFDSPVYGFNEGDGAIGVLSDSFALFLAAELRDMQARAETSRNAGGTWLHVDPGGSTLETFPTRDSGERPLDHPDNYLD